MVATHEDAVRAAVLADLALGMSINAASKKHGVPRTTITRWHKETAPVVIVGQQKQTDLGELLGEYLVEGITTLAAQARHFRDSEWLARQDAAQLATAHGVLADKLTAVISALRPAPEDLELSPDITGIIDSSATPA